MAWYTLLTPLDAECFYGQIGTCDVTMVNGAEMKATRKRLVTIIIIMLINV